jgi:hypothetical protein
VPGAWIAAPAGERGCCLPGGRVSRLALPHGDQPVAQAGERGEAGVGSADHGEDQREAQKVFVEQALARVLGDRCAARARRGPEP